MNENVSSDEPHALRYADRSSVSWTQLFLEWNLSVCSCGFCIKRDTARGEQMEIDDPKVKGVISVMVRHRKEGGIAGSSHSVVQLLVVAMSVRVPKTQATTRVNSSKFGKIARNFEK